MISKNKLLKTTSLRDDNQNDIDDNLRKLLSHKLIYLVGTDCHRYVHYSYIENWLVDSLIIYEESEQNLQNMNLNQINKYQKGILEKDTISQLHDIGFSERRERKLKKKLLEQNKLIANEGKQVVNKNKLSLNTVKSKSSNTKNTKNQKDNTNTANSNSNIHGNRYYNEALNQNNPLLADLEQDSQFNQNLFQEISPYFSKFIDPNNHQKIYGTKPAKIRPRPWNKTLNCLDFSLMDRYLNSIYSYIMKKPGITFSCLCEQFGKTMDRCSLMDLLLYLENENAIVRHVFKEPTTSDSDLMSLKEAEPKMNSLSEWSNSTSTEKSTPHVSKFYNLDQLILEDDFIDCEKIDTLHPIDLHENCWFEPVIFGNYLVSLWDKKVSK